MEYKVNFQKGTSNQVWSVSEKKGKITNTLFSIRGGETIVLNDKSKNFKIIEKAIKNTNDLIGIKEVKSGSSN